MVPQEFHLFGWYSDMGVWVHLAQGSEADMAVRLLKLTNESRALRERQFAAFVSPSPMIPEQPPWEINIAVQDFGAPDTDGQMSVIEAAQEYLRAAHRHLEQAHRELTETDLGPLLPTHEAFAAGARMNDVLSRLDDMLATLNRARAKGFGAVRHRNEVDQDG